MSFSFRYIFIKLIVQNHVMLKMFSFFRYMKYLYPYECEKRRLSTPAELQAAIDGNRREGRRSSYGTYNEMVQRSPIPTSQMSPLSLVTQQQTMMSRMTGGLPNGAHHPSHPPPLGQPPLGGPIPGLAPSEFEARMVEYVKLLNKELRNTASPTAARHGSSSPPNNTTSPINPLEMSRLTLWNLYNNNPTAPPPILNPPPVLEPQREALNLADVNNSPQNNSLSTPITAMKREPEHEEQPPAKRHLQDDDMSPPNSPAPSELSPSQPQTPTTHIGGLSTNIKITNRGKYLNFYFNFQFYMFQKVSLKEVTRVLKKIGKLQKLVHISSQKKIYSYLLFLVLRRSR